MLLELAPPSTITPLGEVISHRKDFIVIDDEVSYVRPKVQLSARGIVKRDKVIGTEIKTKKQQVCQAGQFLVAEIDAKLGGYGIVPPDLDGSIVSSHYYLYDIDPTKLLAGYLGWYVKTPLFFNQISAQGSTNYSSIRPQKVLEYTIPLPALTEQRVIVAQLDAVAEKLEAYRTEAKAHEQELKALLTKAFWQIAEDAPYRPMCEVAPLVRRPVEIDPDTSYTELGVKSFYNGVFHRRTLLGAEYSWQKLFWIKQGDIIFSNIMAWERAIAIALPDHHDCVGNHRILTCEVNSQFATPEYIWFFFTTHAGFSQILEASPGTIARNKTLSADQLMTIQMPCPDITKQKVFSQLISKSRQARQLRAEIEAELASLLPAMLHRAFGNGDNGKTEALQ